MSALPHDLQRFNRFLNKALPLYSAVKVAFAQQAGAKGVIIVNTKENLMRMPAGWMKFKGDVSAKYDYFLIITIYLLSYYQPTSYCSRITSQAHYVSFFTQILIDIPVVMIRGTAGAALKKVLHREPTLYAQFVAKHWTAEGSRLRLIPLVHITQ